MNGSSTKGDKSPAAKPLAIHKFVPSRPKVELLEGLPKPVI